MKNSERPAWMGPSRRASPPAPPKPQPTPVPAPEPAAEGMRPPKASNRGYNPYDTVNTRFPDVDIWKGKPKRS